MSSCWVHLRSSEQHGAGADEYEHQPGRRPAGELFLQHHAGEDNCDQYAQLVYGHHDAGRAVLEGAVIAEPRCAGGEPGEDEEEPAAAAYVFYALLLAGDEHHQPGHN